MEIVSNIDFNNLIPYCIFPNSFIRNGKISTQQKVLFEILCSYDHIDKDGLRKGWCDVSLDKIAEQMGLTKRSVQVHLKRLVECGMVVVVYRNTEMVKDMPKSSIYILNILPGVSDTDRKRISAARTIKIKHLISGLNSIKVQTANGMQYTTTEEFDLELLVTGQRSSTVLEGEILDAEKIINNVEENRIHESELYGYGSHQRGRSEECNETDGEISFGPNRHADRKSSRTGYNSENPSERIRNGNYKGLTARMLCEYFKSVYMENYPDEIYRIDSIKDIKLMNAKLSKVELDIFIPMLEFFIRSYSKLFYSKEFNRPRIYQLSIPWILDKLEQSFNDYEKAKNEINNSSIRKSESTIIL